MKKLLILLAGILLSSAVFSQIKNKNEPLAQNSPYRYDVSVEMVGLFATVLDPSGRVVTDLDRSDFLLYEDGRPQTISQFSREYIPLSILFLLDTSGSMEGEKLINARKSIQQFLKHLIRGDEAMLMEFRGRPRVIRSFTTDFKKLESDLKQLSGYGSTALYDAILSALDQMKSAHNRRRAILLISDGINTYGKAKLEDTLAKLKRNGIELFTIGLETELPEEIRDKLMTREVLARLTRSAGGEAYIINDPRALQGICNMISKQMHNQYSMGYYPRKTIEGEWREITLETKSQGYRVIPSKNGYFAMKEPQDVSQSQ